MKTVKVMMFGKKRSTLRKVLSTWCAFATLATTCSPAVYAGTDVLGGVSNYNVLYGVTDGSGTATEHTFTGAGTGVIDWNTFNVNAGQTMNFSGMDSVWNIVNNNTAASTISGIINGSGNVYVLNPAGIAFGATAVVNVGGLFSAATMGVSDIASFAGAADKAAFLADPANIMAGNADAAITVADGAKFLKALDSDGNWVEYALMVTEDKADSINLAGAEVKLNGGTYNGTVNVAAGNGIAIDSVLGGGVKLVVADTATGNVDLMGDFADALAVKAAGDVQVRNGDKVQAQSVDIETAGNVLVQGESEIKTTGGDVKIASSEGTVTIAGTDTTAATIDAAGKVTITAKENGSGEYGDIVIDKAAVKATGDVTLTADNRLTVNGSDTVAGEISGANVTLKQNGTEASDVLELGAKAKVSADGSTGTVTINNAGKYDRKDGATLAGNNVKVIGLGDVADYTGIKEINLDLSSVSGIKSFGKFDVTTFHLENATAITIAGNNTADNAEIRAAAGNDIDLTVSSGYKFTVTGTLTLTPGTGKVAYLSGAIDGGAIDAGSFDLFQEGGVINLGSTGTLTAGTFTQSDNGTLTAGGITANVVQNGCIINTSKITGNFEQNSAADELHGITGSGGDIEITGTFTQTAAALVDAAGGTLTLKGGADQVAAGQITADEVKFDNSTEDVVLKGSANEIGAISGTAKDVDVVAVAAFDINDITANKLTLEQNATIKGNGAIETEVDATGKQLTVDNTGKSFIVSGADGVTADKVTVTDGTLGAQKINATVTQNSGKLTGAVSDGNLQITKAVTQNAGTIEVGAGTLTLDKASTVEGTVKAATISNAETLTQKGGTITADNVKGAFVQNGGSIDKRSTALEFDSTVDQKKGTIGSVATAVTIEGALTQNGVAANDAVITATTLTLNGGAVQGANDKVVATDLVLGNGTKDVTLEAANEIGSIAGTVKDLKVVDSRDDLTIKTLTANTAVIKATDATDGKGNIAIADGETLTATQNAATGATLTMDAKGDITAETAGKIVNNGKAGEIATELRADGKIVLKGANEFFEMPGGSEADDTTWNYVHGVATGDLYIKNGHWDEYELDIAGGDWNNFSDNLTARKVIDIWDSVGGGSITVEAGKTFKVTEATGEIHFGADAIRTAATADKAVAIAINGNLSGDNIKLWSETTEGAAGVVTADLLKLASDGDVDDLQNFKLTGENKIAKIENADATKQVGEIELNNTTLLNLGDIYAKKVTVNDDLGVVVNNKKVLGDAGVSIDAQGGIAIENGALVKAGVFTDETDVDSAAAADIKLKAAKDIRIQTGAQVGASGNIEVIGDVNTAPSRPGVIIGKATVAARDGVQITATHDDVEIVNDSTIATKGKATVKADGKVSVYNSELVAKDDVTILAGSDVEFGNTAKVASDKSLYIGTAGDKIGGAVKIDNASALAEENVEINAAGRVELGNTAAALVAGKTGVKVDSGAGIQINNNTIVKGGDFTDETDVGSSPAADVTVAADGKIVVAGGSKLAASRDVMLQAAGADGIAINGTGVAGETQVAAYRNLTFKSTAGNVTVDNKADVFANANAELNAVGSVILNQANIGVNANGTILATSDVDIDDSRIGANGDLKIGTTAQKIGGKVMIDQSEVLAEKTIEINAAGNVEIAETAKAKLAGKTGVAVKSDADVTVKNNSLVKAGAFNETVLGADGFPIVAVGDEANLEIAAEGKVAANNSNLGASGNATITGKTGVELVGGNAVANKDLTIKATADNAGIALKNGLVAAKGDAKGVEIEAEKGDVTVTAEKILSGKNASLKANKGTTAVGDLTFIGENAIHTVGNLSLAAANNVTAEVNTDPNVFGVDGDLDVTALAGQIEMYNRFRVNGKSTFDAKKGAVIVKNADNKFYGESDFFGQYIDIEGYDLVLNDLTARGLDIGGGSYMGGYIKALAHNSLTAKNGTLKSSEIGGYITLEATKTMDIQSTSTIKAYGNITLTGGDIAFSGIVESEMKDIAIAATATGTEGGKITGTGAKISAEMGAVTLTADKGIQNTAEITAMKNVTATAAYGGVELTGAIKTMMDLNVTATEAIQLSGQLSVLGATTLTTAPGQAVTAGNTLNELTGKVTITGGDITLANNKATLLGNITGSKFDITKTYAVTQDGIIEVSGTTTIDAGSADVTLDKDNEMAGSIAVKGKSVQINNTIDTELGNVTAKSLEVTAGGAISETVGSVIKVSEGSEFTAATGKDITLDQANEFTGAVAAKGQNIKIVNNDKDLIVGTIDAAGTLDLAAGSEGIRNADGKAVKAADKVTLTAAGIIDIETADFAADKDLVVAGGTTADVTIKNKNGLQLGQIDADTLDLTAKGPITQTGVATVTGETKIDATDGAGYNVTLDQANLLAGAVNVKGNDVKINNAKALVLGDVNAKNLKADATDAITQKSGSKVEIAAGGVADFTADNAGTKADITLGNSGNVLRTLRADGKTVKVNDSNINGLVLDGIDADKDLTLTVAGPLTQTTAGNVTAEKGLTTIKAIGQNVTLDNAGNDFGNGAAEEGKGVLIAAKDIKIVDANDITFDEVDATGAFNVKAGGLLTQADADADGHCYIKADGLTTLWAVGGDVVLPSTENEFNGGLKIIGADNIYVIDNGATDPLSLADMSAKGAIYFKAIQRGIKLGVAATLNANSDGLTGDAIATSATALGIEADSITLVAGNGDFDATADGKLVTGDLTLVSDPTKIMGNVSIDAKKGINISDQILTQKATFKATQNVTVNNLLNDFTGDVAVDASEASSQIVLVDANDITLAKVTGDKLTVTAGEEVKTAVGPIASHVTKLAATAKGIEFLNDKALVLDGIDQTDAAKALKITAKGDITQTQKVLAKGEATFAAADGGTKYDVILNDSNANDFEKNVNVTDAKNVTVKDKNALALGNITAAGNLEATAGGLEAGDLTQAADKALTVAGTTTLTDDKGKIDVLGANKMTGVLTANAKDNLTVRNDQKLTIEQVKSTEGDIVLYTTAGDITLPDAKTIEATKGSVTLAAYKDLNVDGLLTAKADAAKNAFVLFAGYDYLGSQYLSEISAGTTGDALIGGTSKLTFDPDAEANLFIGADRHVTIAKPPADGSISVANGGGKGQRLLT